MSAPWQSHRALLLAIGGWAVQTICLTLFLPVVDLNRVGVVCNVLMLVLSTLVLGLGIALLARQRGHSGAFAVLALANLCGLVMVGMLPSVSGNDQSPGSSQARQ